MSREVEEHVVPFIASAVLSVHRSPDGDEPFGAPVEARIPEQSACTETPAVPRRGTEERDGGQRYDRLSDRRACMRYGATSSNQREEERECPALLAAYRESIKGHEVQPNVKDLRAATELVHGYFDAMFEHADVAPDALSAAPKSAHRFVPLGAVRTIRRAVIATCNLPAMLALDPLAEEPAKKPRRVRKARSEFRSAADVIEVAARGSSIGTGSIDFERLRAETRGRTRANWDEIYCHATPQSGARAKGLAAVEREATARHAIDALGLSDADRLAIVDLNKRRPLTERLLAYRARLLGETALAALGDVLLAQAERLQAATAHLSDNEIRQRVASARRRLEEHLRKLPAIGRRALHEGRPDLLAGPEQLHGLIPERPTARR